MRPLIVFLTVIALIPALADEPLLNPNLAETDALAAVDGMTPDALAAIESDRPFTSALAFDAALSDSLSDDERTVLYRSVFRPLNLNTASEAEIMLIPGMSARMAHEFEEYRPYRSLEQFRREIGKYVDDAEVARLERYVFIPVPLNTASEEDIMRIPGMTPKMVHEFEEYRPYRSMEQFRREIGKYVDAGELARLESYVVLDEAD